MRFCDGVARAQPKHSWNSDAPFHLPVSVHARLFPVTVVIVVFCFLSGRFRVDALAIISPPG